MGGVWVAHGEGRCHFPAPAVYERVKAQGLVPMRYIDDDGAATERYPFNPNGSPDGIVGLCSADGRHLAMMPHPECVPSLGCACSKMYTSGAAVRAPRHR